LFYLAIFADIPHILGLVAAEMEIGQWVMDQ